MTTTPSSIVTTTQIRHGGKTALSISYESTDSVILIKTCAPALRSQIDQAILQWWNLLSPAQRSMHSEWGLNFKITASYQRPLEP